MFCTRQRPCSIDRTRFLPSSACPGCDDLVLAVCSSSTPGLLTRLPSTPSPRALPLLLPPCPAYSLPCRSPRFEAKRVESQLHWDFDMAGIPVSFPLDHQSRGRTCKVILDINTLVHNLRLHHVVLMRAETLDDKAFPDLPPVRQPFPLSP